MKGRNVLACLAVLVMAFPAFMPFSGAIYIGPRVKIDIADTTLNERAATIIYVTVYNESGVLVVGATVNIVAELGTFDQASDVTDATGRGKFIYTAPSVVLEQRMVNITATAVYDLPPYTEATKTIWLMPVPKVYIDGPDQVVKGGEAVRYTVRAVTGSEPLTGGVLNVTPPSLGTIVQNQQATDGNGRAWFDYRPPTSGTGETVLMVSVTPPMMVEPVYGSKTIQVVYEITTMTISVATDKDPVPCWGSSNLTATVRKGNQTVAGATVEWTVTRGWRSAPSTVTDASGRSRIQYTATNATGQLWAGTVTVIARATSGADRADTNMTFDVSPLAVAWTAELGYTSSGGQLLAGEKLTVNLSLRLLHGRPFQFITPVAVGLKLWSGSGTMVYNQTLVHGLSIEPGLDWSSGPVEIFTVPAVPAGFQYFWQARVTSNDSVYTYYEQPVPVKVTLLSQDLPEWTFLMYMCDYNNLLVCTQPYLDRLEYGAPEGQFRYLIQRWATAGVATRQELKRDNIPDELNLEPLGAVSVPDQADPAALSDFLLWGAETAPARHYFLVIYDHGGAWQGACWNADQPPSHIGLKALDKVLFDFANQRRKPDILFFEACLMSSAEVIYELRDRANYIFASETVINGASLLQTPQGLRNAVASFGQGTPNATRLIDAYLDGYVETHTRDYPIALTNLSATGPFYDSLGLLVDRLLAKLNVMGPVVHEAAYEAQIIYGLRDSGIRILVDAQDFLKHLKDSVEMLPLSYRYVDVLAAIDEANEHLQNIFHDRYLDEYDIIGNTGAVNIYFPSSPIYYLDYRAEYLGNISSGYPLARLLEALYYQGPDPGSFQVFPPVNGITQYPLQKPSVNAQDPDGDGLIENISVGVLIDQLSNGIEVNVILDSYASNGTYPGGIGGGGTMNGRTVIPGPAGQQTSQTSEARSNTTDEVNVVATAVTPDGTILQQYSLGVFWMDATPRTGNPPSLDVVASTPSIPEGRPVSFNATATDPDGDSVTIWWDLDERDGMGLDATGPTAQRSYRGTGIRTVTCIASDGKNTVARQLEVNVTANPANQKPVANLTFSFSAAHSVVLNASGSTDPDGDALEYLFVFGDGNSTGWSNRSTAAHTYPNGTYECFVMVRDGCRYNGSAALVTFNVTGQAPPPPPPTNRPPAARFVVVSNLMGAKKPIGFDASVSSDPDNDTLQYRFDWGDGNLSDWSASKTADHTYAMPGTYNVTLTVRDGGNLTAQNTTTIVVKPAPRSITPPKGFIPGPGLAAVVAVFALAGAIRRMRNGAGHRTE